MENVSVFSIVCPSRKLEVTTYTYPDGKLEQYLIAPEESAPSASTVSEARPQHLSHWASSSPPPRMPFPAG